MYLGISFLYIFLFAVSQLYGAVHSFSLKDVRPASVETVEVIEFSSSETDDSDEEIKKLEERKRFRSLTPGGSFFEYLIPKKNFMDSCEDDSFNDQINRCIEAIHNNYIIEDLFSPRILQWHNYKNQNLLHVAAAYQRATIAAILLTLEKTQTYFAELSSSDFKSRLLEERDADGNTPLLLASQHYAMGNVNVLQKVTVLSYVDKSPLFIQYFSFFVKHLEAAGYLYTVTEFQNIYEYTRDALLLLFWEAENPLRKNNDGISAFDYLLPFFTLKRLKGELRYAFKNGQHENRNKIIQEVLMRKKFGWKVCEYKKID